MSSPETSPPLSQGKYWLLFGLSFAALVVSLCHLLLNTQAQTNPWAYIALLGGLYGCTFSIVIPAFVDHYARVKTGQNHLREICDQQFQYLRESLDRSAESEKLLESYISKLAQHQYRWDDHAKTEEEAFQEQRRQWTDMMNQTTVNARQEWAEAVRMLRENDSTLFDGLRTQINELQISLAALAQNAEAFNLLSERLGHLEERTRELTTQTAVITQVDTRLNELATASADRSDTAAIHKNVEELTARVEKLQQSLPQEETSREVLHLLKAQTLQYATQLHKITDALEAIEGALKSANWSAPAPSSVAPTQQHIPAAAVTASRSTGTHTPPIFPSPEEASPVVRPTANEDDAAWWNQLQSTAGESPSPLPPPLSADTLTESESGFDLREAFEQALDHEAAEPPPPSQASSTTTLVRKKAPNTNEVRLVGLMNIGIGNAPYLRGKGPGLSHQKGIPMRFLEIGKWEWRTTVTEAVTIQMLRNDTDPSNLGEITIKPGEIIEVRPQFPET